MTDKEKALAYDKLLVKAKQIYDKENDVLIMHTIEDLFPELKESEDERIRKHLISLVKNWDKDGIASKYTSNPNDIKQILAWLEKQGEQNDSDVKDYNSIDPHFAKPADKVEPKFKVGDYVVGKYISGYISEVRDDCYLLDYQGFSIDKQDNYHLWTIDDAKDGDVLCTPNGNTFIFKTIDGDKILDYCGLYFNKFFSDFGSPNGSSTHYDKCNYHPATKEQRDLLFSKMKEAGYEWDAEKKELKKIDNEEVNGEDYGIDGLWHAQRILEKTLGSVDGYQTDNGILDHKAAITAVKKLYKYKPAWSEEDDYNVQCMIAKAVNDIQNGNVGRNQELIDWLKSLKDRVQPKQEWTEDDKRILDALISSLINERFAGRLEFLKGIKVSSVIDWLKSLKEK